MSDNLLKVKEVSKSYSGNQVLKGVNFDLGKGEILGLVGENGAGKTTLMNIIFGMSVIADTGGFEGEILLDGKPISFKSPVDALKAGIGMVHQEFSLIPDFTVAENITLNMERTKPSVLSKVLGKRLEKIDVPTNIELAGKSLDELGVAINPQTKVKQMPVGHKQFIEIAREITRENTKLIIMDEPTAVLTETEANILITAMKHLASLGISIIFITHRLREIKAVCDKVVILRDGIMVEDKPAKDLTIREMADKMIGGHSQHDDDAIEKARKFNRDDIVMEIKDLRVKMPGEEVQGLSARILKGEIFGVAGLAGQGKLGLPNGILGTYPCQGQVTFQGEDLPLGKTHEILKKGIAFVSEDRRGVGLLLDEPIDWNICFNAMQVNDRFLKKIAGIRLRDEAAMTEAAQQYIQKFEIRTTGPKQKAGALSGGNQQKICLAKAFALNPNFLFVSEPTRGIDIGAKALVLEALRKANKEDGVTIVMVSSELEELRSICDRIAVVTEGKISGILPAHAAPAQFGLLMAGEPLEEGEQFYEYQTASK